MTGGSYSLSLSVNANGELLPPGSLGTGKVSISVGTPDQGLSYGTTSGKADIFVMRAITINATTATTYDLYVGTDWLDVFKDTAAFRKIKSIAIWVNSGGDATGVAIGGAASDAWVANFADSSDKALIYPSGPPWCAGSPAGITVDATHKNLKIENLGAAAVTLYVCIAGSSV